MRILNIAPRTVMPPQDGAAVRMYHLLLHLSQSHEVRLFTQPRFRQLRDKRYSSKVQVTPTFLERRNPGQIAALAVEYCYHAWVCGPIFSGAALRFSRPRWLGQWFEWADIILVDQPYQFPYCRNRAPYKPVVLASHNVEATKTLSCAEAGGFQAERSWWHRYIKALERDAVQGADLTLAVSPADRQAFVEQYSVSSERVIEVPNGSDLERISPTERAQCKEWRRKLGLTERPTVVYTSSIPKLPDREGLEWVRRMAERIPEWNFLVVGGVVSQPAVDANLIKTGVVEDPYVFLKAADLSLCPIQHGGGTKIKLLDSLAACLPTVAFEPALTGTAIRHREHVLVADPKEESLEESLRSLMEDRDLACRLAQNGRTYVCENHDWRRIAVRLEQTLTDLVTSYAAASKP